MDANPLPSAEKKRAKTSQGRGLIRDFLLRPKTWKAAVSALELALKLVRMCLKIWDMLM